MEIPVEGMRNATSPDHGARGVEHGKHHGGRLDRRIERCLRGHLPDDDRPAGERADGKLSVSIGDAISVTYDGCEPVFTYHAAAVADIQPPKISKRDGVADGIIEDVLWATM
jgi:hypothetical protein